MKHHKERLTKNQSTLHGHMVTTCQSQAVIMELSQDPHTGLEMQVLQSLKL